MQGPLEERNLHFCLTGPLPGAKFKVQFPVICWDFSVGLIGQDRSLQAEVIFPDLVIFMKRREGLWRDWGLAGFIESGWGLGCLPSSPAFLPILLRGPGQLGTGLASSGSSSSKHEVPIRCSPLQPPLIYCLLALFGAIKLSRNGNMFLFSHICRMKVNIFIILPPHYIEFPCVKHVGLIKGEKELQREVRLYTPSSTTPFSAR